MSDSPLPSNSSPAAPPAAPPAATPSPAPRRRFVHLYNRRVHGWVVVDLQTNMQVVGPFSLEWVAERAAERRNGGGGK